MTHLWYLSVLEEQGREHLSLEEVGLIRFFEDYLSASELWDTLHFHTFLSKAEDSDVVKKLPCPLHILDNENKFLEQYNSEEYLVFMRNHLLNG